MTVLSSNDILLHIQSGDIRVMPYDSSNVQPASLDLHLGRAYRKLSDENAVLLDTAKDNTHLFPMSFIDKYLDILPGQLVLGETLEVLTLSDKLNAQLAAVSSIARYGLLVHMVAGYIDPGWHGALTLEMVNVTSIPIRVYPSQRIVQAVFSLLETPGNLYNGKYKGAVEPQVSGSHLDFGGNSPAMSWLAQSAMRK
jgi:dCTP deaminase